MTKFNVYNAGSAPEKCKNFLKRWQKKLGLLPNVVGIMAESPALLKGFSDLSTSFRDGSFSPVERFVIDMTIANLNGSAYCIAAHTAWAEKEGIPRDIWTALREEKPLKDARLEALRVFVIAVMKKMGRVDERDINAFNKAGYAKAHVLEVVLGLSLNMIGNYVNHIAAPELDKAYQPHRIELGNRKPGGKTHAA